MMNFEQTAFGAIATNSIRPVRIIGSGESCILEMPEGTLYERLDTRRYFDTFNEAVRYAEANIGMKVNLGES